MIKKSSSLIRRFYTVAIVFFFWPIAVYGASLGDLVNNIMSPLRIVISCFEYLCFFVAGGCGIWSFIKMIQKYKYPYSIKSSTIVSGVVAATSAGLLD